LWIAEDKPEIGVSTGGKPGSREMKRDAAFLQHLAGGDVDFRQHDWRRQSRGRTAETLQPLVSDAGLEIRAGVLTAMAAGTGFL
jgi:hypothetical protein